jgi:flagellin-specific chaperone FliS
MYNNTPAAYRHNPLMDSTSKQISFLFGRIVHFIEEGDRLRNEQQYQEFAYQNQRAISTIHGLSSFLQSELTQSLSVIWDTYFLFLLRDINTHMIEPDPILFNKLCANLRHMEQLLKNVDIQNHIIIDPSNIVEHEANDNLSAPINQNQSAQTDINISV